MESIFVDEINLMALPLRRPQSTNKLHFISRGGWNWEFVWLVACCSAWAHSPSFTNKLKINLFIQLIAPQFRHFAAQPSNKPNQLTNEIKLFNFMELIVCFRLAAAMPVNSFFISSTHSFSKNELEWKWRELNGRRCCLRHPSIHQLSLILQKSWWILNGACNLTVIILF